MNLRLIIYKNRFISGYVVIGLLSLMVELIFYNLIEIYLFSDTIRSFVSVNAGIIISFWLNIKYNFKISKSKRNRSLIYFVSISLLSYYIQMIARNNLTIFDSYEWDRIFFAGCFFWIAYFFHRKVSFKDFKKVGVAIYANGVEDIAEIYKKVDKYADCIHLDIVDKSFNPNSEDVLSYKSEVVKAYWNNKFIEAHIMSSSPIKWIKEISPYVNRIYVHLELNEPLNKVLYLIKELGCECGIVIQKDIHLKFWDEYQDVIDSILVLAIENPGYSGQQFKMETLELIKKVNIHDNRNKISLNVDGGVNAETIKHIKAEYVVSGSYVLNATDPIKNIMVLQTSSQYE
jgi:ribulose-phosphate 3-epimerase